MNLGNLLRQRPNPIKLEIELNKIFEIVDFGDLLFPGWISIDCYDKNNNHRMTIIYRWERDDWWYYAITWTGKKPTNYYD